ATGTSDHIQCRHNKPSSIPNDTHIPIQLDIGQASSFSLVLQWVCLFWLGPSRILLLPEKTVIIDYNLAIGSYNLTIGSIGKSINLSQIRIRLNKGLASPVKIAAACRRT